MTWAEDEYRPYTFIAYKPNSSDYCMGCHMASYSSGFRYETELSKEEVVEAWAECLAYRGRCNEQGWDQIHVLEDGVDVTYDDLAVVAKERAEEIKEERAKEVARKEEAEKAKEKSREEREDHLEYKRLHKRFGGKE